MAIRRRIASCVAALVGTAAVASGVMMLPAGAAPPVSGAVFTTNAGCTGVNLNIYADKGAVYLDGGPAHPGAAGLPDGSYYVQVTTPEGTVLGTSVGSANAQPVHVTNGDFDSCYQLSAILIKTSDGTAGYDDTTNAGGVYKVWVSNDSSFANNSTKTDNFKVKSTVCDTDCTPPLNGELKVVKFYDANANGVNDDGQAIAGWKIHIVDGMDITRETPVDVIVDPDVYTVTEGTPLETNWMHTTPNPLISTVGPGDVVTEQFGNVCVGSGGGLTLGFWSNKNGQNLIGSTDLAMLVGLNLRNANGTNFDPANYAAFRTWLLSATATNMSYMLSAQLSAMELNVFNGKVNGTRLVYAPGALGANALGFITVNALMSEANAALGANGLVLSGHPSRPYQEALKNALDNANNDRTFVQAAPCAFSFAP
jgi:hypothetical protein